MAVELLAMIVVVSIGLVLPRAGLHLAAIATLLADAYLILALLATQRMKPEYHHYLPPFGTEAARPIPRAAWLVLVSWTAILAVGSLKAATVPRPSRKDAAIDEDFHPTP